MGRAAPGPFEQHLLDAIVLNRARAPRYAALSAGESLAISRRLIRAERLLLPVARWFDRWAAPWRRAGIAMLEEIFVPMSAAPSFAEHDAEPATDCLVRHLLDSAHRVASLAPGYVERARERGLPSPHRLLALLFRLHLWGLGAARALDARARPLQERGIPILARDLPPIPRAASDEALPRPPMAQSASRSQVGEVPNQEAP